MRTADEIKELLAQKFAIEKKRLKSYGTKANSFDLAHAVYRHVESLMSDSRYRELKRLEQYIEKEYEGDFKNSHLTNYIQERKRATKAMAKALENVANNNDRNRPWKRTVKKEKNQRGKRHNRH